MPFSFAILSADCPMDSPVLGSAMAGVMGTRSRGRSCAKVDNRCDRLFAFDAATNTSLIPRECSMGTCVSDSAPPAMAILA